MGNNNEDKLRALDAALGQIEKQYGKGAVMKLGDSAANMNVETIPTGSLSLDSRSTETRRNRRLHRCRACARSGLCQKHRC